MARYRVKDETDLQWNSIRRRLTKELDVQIADFREVALNSVLSEAWTHFAESLAKGERPALEPHYKQFVKTALKDAGVRVKVGKPK